MNDKKVTIVNDKKVTIMNDKKVTIMNDKKVTVVNDMSFITGAPKTLPTSSTILNSMNKPPGVKT